MNYQHKETYLHSVLVPTKLHVAALRRDFT